MKTIHNADAKKRGCRWCADSIKPEGRHIRKCPYDECPYHELDGYKTYHDYLKETSTLEDVADFLKGLGL